MSKVNVKEVLGAETTPAKDGFRLAEHILNIHRAEYPGIELDVCELAPEDLVSNFVNSFLVALKGGGLDVTVAGALRWVTKFDRERERLVELVHLFVEDELGTPVPTPIGDSKPKAKAKARSRSAANG